MTQPVVCETSEDFVKHDEARQSPEVDVPIPQAVEEIVHIPVTQTQARPDLSLHELQRATTQQLLADLSSLK